MNTDAILVGKNMKHKTMASAAAEEIRRRILNETYPPGLQLKQDILAREFGMSRIPVREALLILEKEGLIKVLPHRGAIVAELTFDEVEELFNMRMLLEPYLLERSVPHLTAEAFAQLWVIQDAYRDALDNDDIAEWNDLNKQFHMMLYQHADSPRIASTVQNLLTECDIHTRIQLINIEGDRERAVAEHSAILRLCEEGRIEEASAALRQHLDHIRSGLLSLVGTKRAQPAA
jgi:DNA-binding GntR family transcriptional regulator